MRLYSGVVTDSGLVREGGVLAGRALRVVTSSSPPSSIICSKSNSHDRAGSPSRAGAVLSEEVSRNST